MNPTTSECLIVIYHYVRDVETTPFSGIKGRRVEAFTRQVEYLHEHYTIVTLRDYLSRRDEIPEQPFCVLTFDDGLKEHVTTVLPIFARLGISGTFFVPTKPILEQWVAPVHKVHFLLSVLGAEKFLSQFEDSIESRYKDVVKLGDIPQTVNNPWDDPTTSRLKRVIAATPEDIKRELLGELFSVHIGDEKTFSQDLYVSPEEVRTLHQAGMEVGGHSHSHRLLSQISPEDQREEITISHRLLSDIIGDTISTFSYPNGVSTDIAIETLENVGYKGAVTVEKGLVTKASNPFLLSRIDTNDAPGL